MNQKTGAFACKKRERLPARFKMKWLLRMAWASGVGGGWSAAGQPAAGRQLVGSARRKKTPRG